MLGGEPLDHVVGVGSKADLQGADGRVLPDAVEDHDPARPAQGDVARQAIGELAPVTKASGVEDVVPVEEVEHRLRMPGMEPERVYLDELAARLRKLLGRELVGIYAGGSYALGGYERGRSDLDVAAVVRRPLAEGAAAAVVASLRHEALACPARKLELVLYGAAAAQSDSVDADFELNLNTGANEPLRAETVPRPGEAHWFAIDRSILAGRGVTVLGPPARTVFASPPRGELLPLLAQILRWYLREAPESEDGVLNAGRSLRFARDGVWTSKPEMRSWAAEALEDSGTKRDVLRRAIADLERL